jgi:hypothetical protein
MSFDLDRNLPQIVDMDALHNWADSLDDRAHELVRNAQIGAQTLRDRAKLYREISALASRDNDGAIDIHSVRQTYESRE